MKIRFIPVALTAMAVSGLAIAESGSTQIQYGKDFQARSGAQAPAFSQLDTDSSGTISRNEAGSRPNLAERWDKYDNDEDGELNRAEFSAFEKADLQDRSKRMEKTPGEAQNRMDRAK